MEKMIAKLRRSYIMNNMKPAAIFQKILYLATFLVMIYYIYYFNLIPIGKWLDLRPSATNAPTNIQNTNNAGNTKKLSTTLSPARNLSGKWLGLAPQGAFYRDYVANYACSYEADLTLNIKQGSQSIDGSVIFRVRKSTQKLQGIPCLPTNYSFELPINGTVSGTNIVFSNVGIPNLYLPMRFTGTFISDIMSGTFERPPSSQDLAGLKGEWQITKSR